MSRISAAQNLTIEIEDNRWRLLTNGDGPERVLVEAAPGEPLRYIPLFASKRHLPDIGVLPIERVQRVVLGWSGSDGAWHLGLMLDPDLAEMRGSRWCEMAHWIDPDRSLYGRQATEAGESLAESIAKPFNLIPPREEEAFWGLHGAVFYFGIRTFIYEVRTSPNRAEVIRDQVQMFLAGVPPIVQAALIESK